MKSAQTDAIKKALSYFSVGNRAYLGMLGKPKSQRQALQPSLALKPPRTTAANGKASDTQTAAIRSLIRMKGLNLDAVQKEFTTLSEITSEKAKALITHLSQLPTPS